MRTLGLIAILTLCACSQTGETREDASTSSTGDVSTKEGHWPKSTFGYGTPLYRHEESMRNTVDLITYARMRQAAFTGTIAYAACPLDTPALRGKPEMGTTYSLPSSSTTISLMDQRYDALFDLYDNCISIRGIFPALTQVSNGGKSTDRQHDEFVGMFLMSEKYCIELMKKYSYHANDIVLAAHLEHNSKLQVACAAMELRDITKMIVGAKVGYENTLETFMSLLYFGHVYGQGSLQNLINRNDLNNLNAICMATFEQIWAYQNRRQPERTISNDERNKAEHTCNVTIAASTTAPTSPAD